MCGICGFISRKNISYDTLVKINNTMAHRGPDDSGAQILEGSHGYHIGLAHRRLSILDLSANGHQPMWAVGNDVAVVFNGEIYNYMELKEELHEYAFTSGTDTEVILAAYLKWGKSIADKIKGMFAIAIYDRRSEELILIRDHIGKKPLYLYHKGNDICFASELKPIIALDWTDKCIDRDVLSRYLFHTYICAPDSIFKYVSKVEPGTMVTIYVADDLSVSSSRYWDVNASYHANAEHEITDFSDAKHGLEQIITEAVRKRLVADVPVGCLLSGGIDSTLVAAIAQKLSDSPIKTFTIGFEEKQYDEAIYSKDIARHIGTDHTELYISVDEMLKQVNSIAAFYDEPFADSSQIPSMLVASLVHQQATVCLTGDGGDEIFGGYSVYDKTRAAQLLSPLGYIAHGLGQIPIPGGKLSSLYPNKVRKIANNIDRETQAQMNPDVFMRNAYMMVTDAKTPAYDDKRISAACQYRWESKYGVHDWVTRRMLLDLETSLPGDMLCKVDRASMKYSVEMRSPLLDKDVVEYAFRIPQKYKYASGKKKYILKELTYDYVPATLLDRPKMGFSVPIDKWMRCHLKDRLMEYSDTAFLKNQGLFNAEYTSRLVRGFLTDTLPADMTCDGNSSLVWAFFVFQQWYERYLG